MNDNSERVSAIVKELLNLNRAHNLPMTLPLTAHELEARKVARKKIRQELVRALSNREL